jgi:hypothetical protein
MLFSAGERGLVLCAGALVFVSVFCVDVLVPYDWGASKLGTRTVAGFILYKCAIVTGWSKLVTYRLFHSA